MHVDRFGRRFFFFLRSFTYVSFFSAFMEFYHVGVSFLVVSCPSVNIWRCVSFSVKCSC